MNVTCVAAAAALMLAAAAQPTAAQIAAGPAAAPGADLSEFRPLDLPAPNQYRSGSGKPGPRYWQQRADYRIQTVLDTAAHSVRGSESIRYHNRSPDTLRFVWLQVDQNLYRPGALGTLINPAESRWGARGFVGGMDIQAAVVDGQAVRPYIYDTMMRLDLPRPLPPGQSVDVQVGWAFVVPEHGSDRLAREGKLYQIAQWYPRLAVYDDVSGWNTDPYLGQGEFYREFGDYDVAITVPAGYVVAATGTLQNPTAVLTAPQYERLQRAARSADQVAIITAAEAGRAARAGGTQTWRFRARNVHDFAWSASPDFRWDSESWNGVQCHAFYQPADTAWVTAADMTCVSIQEFSRWLPYPYPQATSVAGPVGGMEYPMIVFVHGDGDEKSVFGTIAHEHGHEWFPMIVSSNERRHAWMDEGFNTFIDAFASELRYPGVPTRYTKTFARENYEQAVARGVEQAISTPPDRIDRAGLGVAAYRKPAMVLHLLRDKVVGPDAFDTAFREYIRRWAFKHPTPADFFRTMQDVTGRDLDWFWRQWIYTTDTLDQAVTDVAQARNENGTWNAAVTLASHSSVLMPVDLRLLLANGETRDIALPVEIWYSGRRYTFPLELPAAIAGVVIDPGNDLPDQNRGNNAWGTARK